MAPKAKRDIAATREALLQAAKELLVSCTDADEVTSRAISTRANVNVAMINYCYGSRENLLYAVFQQLLRDAQTQQPELVTLLTADLPPKEKIILLHFHMMRLMIANFHYARAVTQFILLNRPLDSGLEVLPFIMAHFGGRRTESECRRIAFELTSLHELAVLKHAELKQSCGIDLSDDAALERYVRSSVNRFLEEEEPYV